MLSLVIPIVLSLVSTAAAGCAANDTLDGRPLGEFRIGALFPMFINAAGASAGAIDTGGVQRMHGFLMALREINNKTDGIGDNLLPNTTLKLAARDSKRDTGAAFFGALHLCDRAFGDAGVHVFVGAASSAPSIQGALISTEFRTPQISYSATTSDLSSFQRFPMFMRMPPSDAYQGRAMAHLVQHYGWESVVTVSSGGSYGLAGIFEFESAARLEGIHIAMRVTFSGTDSGKAIEDTKPRFPAIIKQIYDSGYRVIVYFGPHIDGCEYNSSCSLSLCSASRAFNRVWDLLQK